MSKFKKSPSAKAPKAKKVAADAAANAVDLVPLKDATGTKANGGKKPKAEKLAKEPNPAKAPRPPRPSGLTAAYQVLLDAGEPMQCKVMVEKVLAAGTWKTGGKTPEATIYAAIIREIRAKGAESRFRKTDRGLFEAIKQ